MKMSRELKVLVLNIGVRPLAASHQQVEGQVVLPPLEPLEERPPC